MIAPDTRLLAAKAGKLAGTSRGTRKQPRGKIATLHTGLLDRRAAKEWSRRLTRIRAGFRRVSVRR